jgi:hypothetical protein
MGKSPRPDTAEADDDSPRGFDSPLHLMAAEAAGQWGMFTAAQALRAGLTRNGLTRMVTRRHFDPTDTRGVYRFAGTPVDIMLDQTRANWLSLSPKLFLRERIKTLRDADLWNDAIVSHLTAANYIYELGNRQPDHCDFTVNTARRIRNPDVCFYPRTDKPAWHNVHGLPVTTIAQTIADLYADSLDRGHLGEIVYDAMLRHGASLHDIAAALDPVTDHNGRTTALGLLEAINAPTDIVTANDLLYNLGR